MPGLHEKRFASSRSSAEPPAASRCPSPHVRREPAAQRRADLQYGKDRPGGERDRNLLRTAIAGERGFAGLPCEQPGGHVLLFQQRLILRVDEKPDVALAFAKGVATAGRGEEQEGRAAGSTTSTGRWPCWRRYRAPGSRSRPRRSPATCAAGGARSRKSWVRVVSSWLPPDLCDHDGYKCARLFRAKSFNRSTLAARRAGR